LTNEKLGLRFSGALFRYSYIYREKIRKNKKHKKYGVTGVTYVTVPCNPYSVRITEGQRGYIFGYTMVFKNVTKEMTLMGGSRVFQKKIFLLYISNRCKKDES